MMNHTRSRQIGSISSVAILSLILAIHLAMPGTTVKAQQPSDDDTYPEILAKFYKYWGELEKVHPDAVKSFKALDQAVFKPGALDTKSKELICLGIAVSIRCDGCIAFHTRGSLEAGATEEEIIEALGVAIFMGGGPSVAYATHAMEAMLDNKAFVIMVKTGCSPEGLNLLRMNGD